MEFVVEAPSDPDEAVRRLAESPAGSVAVLAGGTDLLLDLDAGRLRVERVLSLRKLPWRAVTPVGARWRLGSLCPLRDVERAPGLADALPGFHEAVRAVGSVALRARATLGGNIVRSAPASDLLPILLAYEATVTLRGPEGVREVPLESLLHAPRAPALRPHELVEAVTIPRAGPSAFLWQRVRPTNDISQVGVAVARPGPDGPWRIALGGIAPLPARAPEAEARVPSALPPDGEIAQAAGEAARQARVLRDRRATESYRRGLLEVLTRRALERARARAEAGGDRWAA